MNIGLHHIFRPVPPSWCSVFAVLFLMLGPGAALSRAQVLKKDRSQSDSLSTTNPPPVSRQDSLPNPAGQTGTPGGGGSGSLKKGEVKFQSTDSLVFTFRGDRIANLYGAAKVNHNSGKLKSGKVTLNLDKNTVYASTATPQDTLSQPVLTREGQPPVRSQKVAFNYQTKKGRFDVARVKIDKGKITGTKVKNTSPKVAYLEDAIYSTCTLPHPHYYISADRVKVVKHNNGKKEIFFKNARLYLLDIPYPIVFPFGYLPGNLSKHQSGLLTPTYVFQDTRRRGLGLRNLGWFQYFNDYIVGQASVDIFTSGTFFLNASTDYRDRNSFSGGVQIGYSRQQGLESSDPGYTVQTDKKLSINHRQQFSPYSNISVNVNLRTSDYYQNNSYDVDQRAEQSTGSSINYHYKQPENLFTFDASIRQNQNFATNVTRIDGPSFNFNLKQFTPFSNDTRGNETSKWYENISVNYGNSFQSKFDFRPTRRDSANINWFEALLDPDKYRQATDDNQQYKFGFQQNADLSISDLLNSQHLNLSANLSYDDYYYPTSIRKSFNPDSNDVTTRRLRGFSTAREFSSSLNFSTTFYGISHAKIGHIAGFRHTIRPTVSLNYQPDFSSDFFGYYRTVQTDSAGHTRRYSIFEDEVFGGPGATEQRAINFGINNTFEAKQVKRDSTGEKSEKIIRLVDQFNLSSGYNFAADSLKLANLNVLLTSSIVKGVNLRANADFNFYDRNEQGSKVNRLLLANDKKLAELTNFTLSASTSFSGGGRRGVQVNQTPSFPAHYNPLNQSLFRGVDPYFNRQPVQRINSPWSVSVNFNYRWNLNPTGDSPTKSATINAQNIKFQLTPKWSFSTRIGYDFIQKKLTPSRFRLNRQLHEWNLSFEMNPFGDFQYYFFKLSINSSQIQSIFQKLPLLKNLERSSSPTGRGLGGFR